MSAAELELLCETEIQGKPHKLAPALRTLDRRLRQSAVLFVHTGMIAYGIHAGARTIAVLEILVAPMSDGATVSEECLVPEWPHRSIRPSLNNARFEEDRRAIAEAETHTVFGCDISISPARNLLWRLCRREDPESFVLASDLLTSCRVDVERLREEMVDSGAPDAVRRLDIAVNQANLRSTRTYAASRERRRISEGARAKW